jgi:hypothetical protein
MADFGAILAELRAQLGKKYVWGSAGPNTFDCSGLVQYVYGHHGIKVPRTSAEQAHSGQVIPKGQQQPGDLLFTGDGPLGEGHVQIFIGGGQIIEAPHTGVPVRVAALNLGRVKNIRRVGGIGGWTGTGSASITSTTGSAQAVSDPFAGITAALGGIGQSFAEVSAVAETLQKLALPQTWVRIVAGVAGTSLVFFGMWKLIGEVRN